MADIHSLPRIATDLEGIHRELHSALTESDWVQLASLEDRKEEQFRALELVLKGEPTRDPATLETMDRLRKLEEIWSRRLSEEMGRTSAEIRAIDDTSKKTRQVRSFYGSQQRTDPHWEHYS